MPLDILCPPPADSLPETHESFAREHVSKLRFSYDLVRQHLDSSQRCSKARHDRNSRASPLNVGDQVWLHRHPPPQVSPKFFKYWSGPWKIVTKPTDVTYAIEPRFESPIRHRPCTVHRNRLRKCLIQVGPARRTPLAAPTRPPLAAPTRPPVAAPTRPPLAAPTRPPLAAPTRPPLAAPTHTYSTRSRALV